MAKRNRRARADAQRAPKVNRRAPRLKVDDTVRVKMGAPQAYRGQQGQIVGVEGRARYHVQLEDGTTAPLYSWWLELQ